MPPRQGIQLSTRNITHHFIRISNQRHSAPSSELDGNQIVCALVSTHTHTKRKFVRTGKRRFKMNGFFTHVRRRTADWSAGVDVDSPMRLQPSSKRRGSTSSGLLPARAGWRVGPTGCSPPSCCVIAESRKAIRRKSTRPNWLFCGERADGGARPQRPSRASSHPSGVCRDGDEVDEGEGSWKCPASPTIST